MWRLQDSILLKLDFLRPPTYNTQVMKRFIAMLFVGLGISGFYTIDELAHPVTTETEEVSKVIVFDTITSYDNTLREGTIKTEQEGSDGEKQVTYTVSYKNEKEIKRELVKEVVTKEAVPEKVTIGTKRFYTCSNGTEYETVSERDECEKRIRWEEQKNESLQECYNDSSKFNCWYDEYPGTTLHWSYYTYTYTPTTNTNRGYRTGAICRDGWHSYATGRGACSHHGGVDYWLY